MKNSVVSFGKMSNRHQAKGIHRKEKKIVEAFSYHAAKQK